MFFDYNSIRQSRKVIIDASHGGDDTGVVVDGVSEKNLVLDISKYMYDRLRSLGVPVSITRDSDVTLTDENRVDKILNTYGNSSDVIVISNHVDSDEDSAQIIYALRNNSSLANLIERQLTSVGLNVKEPYQRRLSSDTSKDYYSIHRNTGVIQPVLIQYGNMSDYSDIQANYKKYVDAVVSAISSYLGIAESDGDYYIVKSGDTLYSIARNYNLTVNELKELNNLSSNFLTIGQKLLINKSQKDNVVAEGANIYIVKSGDTLYSVARKYNVTVNELKSYNNLTSNVLSVGQFLKIPVKSEIQDYVLYIVKSGDNLYSISRKYNVTVDDIKNYNNLSSNLLSIGQVLKIPSASVSEGEKVDYIEYVVKRGDNLYNIANNYNTSVSEIMSFNNLSTNLLSIGQILKIPVSEEEVFVYTVKRGDNLYSIAREYNTTVDSIKAKNNLTSNLLSIGQTLVI